MRCAVYIRVLQIKKNKKRHYKIREVYFTDTLRNKGGSLLY